MRRSSTRSWPTATSPKGTTGAEALQAGLVHEEKVAKGSVPPSIVTNANDLNGKVAAAQIGDKQFITAETFVSAQDGTGGAFANSISKDDLVAVTVTVDADHGVANQIAPGDRVEHRGRPRPTPTASPRRRT